MRFAAVALLLSVASLLAAPSSGAGSIHYRTIQAGSSFRVSGTPLACVTGKTKGSIALSCFDLNPKTNDVYRESVGASLIAGRAAHVVIIGYTKDGNEFSLWRHDQPHHSPSGLFPAGKKVNGLVVHPGDRLAIEGTAIFCGVATRKLACLVMNTKTLMAVPGTYGILASASTLEIGRFNSKLAFEPVKAYHEPKFKG